MAKGESPAQVQERRHASARSIKPGWTLMNMQTWQPRTSRPEAKHLVEEVKRRAAEHGLEQPRCKSWSWTQLVNWLENQDTEVTSSTASGTTETGGAAGGVAALVPASPRRNEPRVPGNSTNSPPPPPPPKRNWARNPCRARMILGILKTRDDYLVRDCTPSRQRLDARELNVYWEDLAELLNSNEHKPRPACRMAGARQAPRAPSIPPLLPPSSPILKCV